MSQQNLYLRFQPKRFALSTSPYVSPGARSLRITFDRRCSLAKAQCLFLNQPTQFTCVEKASLDRENQIRHLRQKEVERRFVTNFELVEMLLAGVRSMRSEGLSFNFSFTNVLFDEDESKREFGDNSHEEKESKIGNTLDVGKHDEDKIFMEESASRHWGYAFVVKPTLHSSSSMKQS